MPSFDQPVKRLTAVVAAATEAAQRLPTCAVRDTHGRQEPVEPVVDTPRNRHEELAEMVLELQTNQVVLEGLTRWYGVFVFTGGQVPTAPWNLVAMTSYLKHPLAADCLSISEIHRYRHLAQAISELGHPGTGPTTLRYRHDLGDKFVQAASEMRGLANTLELSLTKAVEELPHSSG